MIVINRVPALVFDVDGVIALRYIDVCRTARVLGPWTRDVREDGFPDSEHAGQLGVIGVTIREHLASGDRGLRRCVRGKDLRRRTEAVECLAVFNGVR